MLTERFEDALVYAARLHKAQLRKATPVPYVAHLLAVAGLVLEHGGGEDEAIAALLHDAIEDQSNGGRTRDEIGARFGDRVLAIVLGCSDTESDAGAAKSPWRARKEAYIAHLSSAPDAVRLVSAADKLHNARSVLEAFRESGDAAFDRFTGKKDGTLWYYGAIVDALRGAVPGALHRELERTVQELVRLAA
jgi:GTP pyrophosphokinase